MKIPPVAKKAGFILAIAIPGIALAQYLKSQLNARFGTNKAVAIGTKVLPS